MQIKFDTIPLGKFVIVNRLSDLEKSLNLIECGAKLENMVPIIIIISVEIRWIFVVGSENAPFLLIL